MSLEYTKLLIELLKFRYSTCYNINTELLLDESLVLCFRPQIAYFQNIYLSDDPLIYRYYNYTSGIYKITKPFFKTN